MWKLAVSSADDAPESAPILLKGTICDNLKKASLLGYDAIEVHMRENDPVDYAAIKAAEKKYGVKVCMIITGRLNTEGKCNLTDDRPYIVKAAMEGLKQYIDIASGLKADLVIGWIKGNVPAGGNRDKYMNRLAVNLHELAAYGEEKNVKLNIEIINHYETNIFNTAAECMDFLEKFMLGNCYIHLDTFHMNIDETSCEKAIRRCGSRLNYMHFADNSRCFPGSGGLAFEKILKTLTEIGYKGYLSVECLPKPSSEAAARKAAEYLKKCISGL